MEEIVCTVSYGYIMAIWGPNLSAHLLLLRPYTMITPDNYPPSQRFWDHWGKGKERANIYYS